MTIQAPHDLAEVRAFLATHRLPTDDLGAAPTDIRVAVRDGILVGTVAVERRGRVGLLRSVAVAPNVRRTGLGRRLVEAAEVVAQGHRLDALYLLTTDAAPFFERLGYDRVERMAMPEGIRSTAQFQGLCPSSAVCMGKLLSHGIPRGTE